MSSLPIHVGSTEATMRSLEQRSSNGTMLTFFARMHVKKLNFVFLIAFF